MPSQYAAQMQWQMACTGRQWCDFVSYDPRLPENMQMFIHRMERDNKMIAELEGEVVKFIEELESKIAQLGATKGNE